MQKQGKKKTMKLQRGERLYMFIVVTVADPSLVFPFCNLVSSVPFLL